MDEHPIWMFIHRGGGVRHMVLALGPAPIHISMGFQSTQGAEYLQYALVDGVMAPPEYAPHWAERLILLPAPALVKDFDLSLKGVLSLPSERDTSLRSQFGLPEQGILFCSFGEALKLDASIVQVWMRILQRTPNSTLWLPRYNALAEEHLRLHFRQQGLQESRLIFSPPALRCLGGRCTRHNGKGSLVLSDSEYLAASLSVDIYLDTGPTLASPLALSSLLWAAVPGVALAGERGVARGSASLLLSSVESAWLVANSALEYEELAVSLARRPAALAALRDKLRDHRTKSSLFNTTAWTRGLVSFSFSRI